VLFQTAKLYCKSNGIEICSGLFLPPSRSISGADWGNVEFCRLSPKAVYFRSINVLVDGLVFKTPTKGDSAVYVRADFGFQKFGANQGLLIV
jgi:hypothetical protein